MQRKGSKLDDGKLIDLTKEIEKAEEAEAAHWRQRARLNWLAYGDRNTRLFHQRATKRKRKNTITQLEDGNGKMITDEGGKATIIRDFFKELFKSRKPSGTDMESVTEAVHEQLRAEDHAFLEKEYDSGDVTRAIYDMHPSKAQGPDGFPACFYQRFWPKIGDEMTEAVLRVLNGEEEVEEWNDTLLTFIPKNNKPRSIKEFRPLSLCNTTYKVVAKCITNRLKRVLGNVIDEHQSAFIRDRLITDNILISYECQHWMRNQKR